MIRGLHGLLYSSEPEALREYLRDKVRLRATDIGGGWLIFDLPEGDLGVHPTEGGGAASGTHDVSFYCDDIHGTVADMRSRGVTFDCAVEDHGYGYVTYMTMPGGVRVQLYEPKYAKPKPKAAKKATAKKSGAKKDGAKKAAKKKAPAKKSAAKKKAPARKAPAKKAAKEKAAKKDGAKKAAKKKGGGKKRGSKKK